jgi:hypothetical protein
VAELERRRRRIPLNLVGGIIREVSNAAPAYFFPVQPLRLFARVADLFKPQLNFIIDVVALDIRPVQPLSTSFGAFLQWWWGVNGAQPRGS